MGALSRGYENRRGSGDQLRDHFETQQGRDRSGMKGSRHGDGRRRDGYGSGQGYSVISQIWCLPLVGSLLGDGSGETIAIDEICGAGWKSRS